MLTSILVGIVFAPTLNVPAPLINSFVEDQEMIFGEPIEEAELPALQSSYQQSSTSSDLRSPRKQMFSDLPSPAYNQTQFQSLGSMHQNDTGMVPVQPAYQMAPQGDGGYGSLNDLLAGSSPQSYNKSPGGLSVPKDVKSKRRESSMMMMSQPGSTKKTPTLMGGSEQQGGRF